MCGSSASRPKLFQVKNTIKFTGNKHLCTRGLNSDLTLMSVPKNSISLEVHHCESHWNLILQWNYLQCSMSQRGTKPGQHQQPPALLQTAAKHQQNQDPKFTNPPAETALSNEQCALVGKFCCTNFSSTGAAESVGAEKRTGSWAGVLLRHFLQQFPIVLSSNCLRHKQSEDGKLAEAP